MPGLLVDVEPVERLDGRRSEALLLPELLVLIEVRFRTARFGTLIVVPGSAEIEASAVMTPR